MSKLKPCPFCGSENIDVSPSISSNHYDDTNCFDCGASAPTSGGDMTWNNRVEDTRIAELEAQIVRLERFTKKQAKQLEVCAGKGRQDVYIPPKGTQFSHKVADEFWRVWELNGTYSQHGYYESTWMAIWAALKVDAPKEQQ